MMARRHAYVVTVLLAFGTLQVAAQGQQNPPPGATTQTRGGSRGATTTTPQPASAGPLPQGFSVVLVLGDIVAGPGQDDVPPAARKALVDMKDFLPYKSYRLLDAAWVLCCGRDQRTTALAERSLIAEFGNPGAVTTQLRGPESKEYELRLSAARAEGARAFVRFSLMESADSAEAEETMSTAETQRRKELTDLRSKAEALEKEMQRKRETGLVIKNLETELERVQARITDLTARSAYESARRQHSANKTVIDTSFTMDLGETVVVGTSRLKAGSKALIALLTAVPPRGSTRPPDEAR